MESWSSNYFAGVRLIDVLENAVSPASHPLLFPTNSSRPDRWPRLGSKVGLKAGLRGAYMRRNTDQLRSAARSLCWRGRSHGSDPTSRERTPSGDVRRLFAAVANHKPTQSGTIIVLVVKSTLIHTWKIVQTPRWHKIPTTVKRRCLKLAALRWMIDSLTDRLGFRGTRAAKTEMLQEHKTIVVARVRKKNEL